MFSALLKESYVSQCLQALGTRFGHVYIMDPSGALIKALELHKGCVNDISIDYGGEWIASCGDDGAHALLHDTVNSLSSQARLLLYLWPHTMCASTTTAVL